MQVCPNDDVAVQSIRGACRIDHVTPPMPHDPSSLDTMAKGTDATASDDDDDGDDDDAEDEDEDRDSDGDGTEAGDDSDGDGDRDGDGDDDNDDDGAVHGDDDGNSMGDGDDDDEGHGDDDDDDTITEANTQRLPSTIIPSSPHPPLKTPFGSGMQVASTQSLTGQPGKINDVPVHPTDRVERALPHVTSILLPKANLVDNSHTAASCPAHAPDGTNVVHRGNNPAAFDDGLANIARPRSTNATTTSVPTKGGSTGRYTPYATRRNSATTISVQTT